MTTNRRKHSMHDLCMLAVGKRVRFRGTNGNEYDKLNYGQIVEGQGLCTAYHDSHGLCLTIEVSNSPTPLCVDFGNKCGINYMLHVLEESSPSYDR